MPTVKKNSIPPLPSDDTKVTLREARDWLRSQIMDDGAPCPCCTQLAKVYKRSINFGMAYVLLKMHKHTQPGEFVHVQQQMAKWNLPSSVAASGDYAKLRYWGLIAQQEGSRDDGSSRNGFWSITEAGRAFVRGETSIRSKVLLYNDRLLRVDCDSKKVGIQEALGSKFDYSKLMLGQ